MTTTWVNEYGITLSADAPDEDRAAAWADEIMRACLEEARGDASTALEAANYIFSTHPHDGVQLGMVGDEWHGPKPPGPGWAPIQPGPRGGKRWKNTGRGAPAQQPPQPGAAPTPQQPLVPVANKSSAHGAPPKGKAPTKAQAKAQLAVANKAALQKKKADVQALIAQIGKDPSKITIDQVKDIGDVLSMLTVPETKALLAGLNMKAGKTKAENVQKIQAEALAKVGLKPPAIAVPPVPTAKPPIPAPKPVAPPPKSPTPAASPVAPPSHPVQQAEKASVPPTKTTDAKKSTIKKMMAGLDNSTLSTTGKAEHARGIKNIMERMSDGAHEDLDYNLPGIKFYDTSDEMVKGVKESLKRGVENDASMSSEDKKKLLTHYANADITGALGICIGGKEVHSDGVGKSHYMYNRKTEYENSTSEGTTAHELTHAIDGPECRYSNSARFFDAWEKEIKGNLKLTEYAGTSAVEGFAEFGRLMYGSDVPLERIERSFPMTSAYVKSKGLWPNPRKTGVALAVSDDTKSSSILPELFNKRVQLPGSDTSHADCMVEKGLS